MNRFKFLLPLLMLLPFLVPAQKIQPPLLYGRAENRLITLTLQGIPSDTFAIPTVPEDLRVHSFIASKNGTLYIHVPGVQYWQPIQAGAGIGPYTFVPPLQLDGNQVSITPNSFPTMQQFLDSIVGKQAKLIDGLNLSTINGQSLQTGVDIVISSGTLTPANFANSYFDDGKTGTFNGVAQISEDGNTIYNLLDNNTGALTTWQKVTAWADGTPMTDAKIDSAIYRKKGANYFKRVYENGEIDAAWFLRPGTPDVIVGGQSANGLRIQTALDLITAMPNGGVLTFNKGDYIFTPTATRKYGFMVHSNTTVRSKQGANLQCGTTGMGGYQFIYIWGATNVTIDGLNLIGDRETNPGDGSYHADGTYYGGESGMGIYLDGTTDVRLLNLHIGKFWGDGIYIGNRICYNTIIDNCYVDWNRRNGMTITWAENTQVSNSHFINTKGTWPMAGIDIEPNEGTWVNNTNLVNIVANDNGGGGITSSGNNVTASNITAKRNGYTGMSQSGLGVNHDNNSGFILKGADLSFNAMNGLNLEGSAGNATVSGVHANGNGTLTVLANSMAVKPAVGDVYSYGGEYTFIIPASDTLPAVGDIYQDDIYQYKVAEVWVAADGYPYVTARMNNTPQTFPLGNRVGTIYKVSGAGKASYAFGYMKTTGEIEFTVKKVSVGEAGIDTLDLQLSKVSGTFMPPYVNGKLVRKTGVGDTTLSYTSWSNTYANQSFGVNIYSMMGSIKVEGSVMLNNVSSGIVQNFYNNADIDISHNTINGNGNGMFFKNNYGKLHGNTIQQNDNINSGEGAVTLYGGRWSLIGNHINNNQQTGLYIWSDGNLVVANTISGNSQKADASYSNIIVGGNNADNTIQSNRISKGQWLNQPEYGILLRSGTGTGNSVIDNIPAIGMAKSADIINQQSGNIIQVPGNGSGSADLSEYVKATGRVGGQTIIGGINNNDGLRLITNPNGSGKLYFGKYNNRNYYDESTGNFSLDSNRLYVDGNGVYVGKFYDNNTQKLTLKNTGSILTGTQGGWVVGHMFEDYLHNNLGGFGGWGNGETLYKLWIGKSQDSTWLDATPDSVRINAPFKLKSVPINGNAAFKQLLIDDDGNVFKTNQQSGINGTDTVNVDATSGLYVKANSNGSDTISQHESSTTQNGYMPSTVWATINGKENAFTKNNAFNKNFGTTAGTVAEGNDSRILNGQTAYSWGNHAGLYLPNSATINVNGTVYNLNTNPVINVSAGAGGGGDGNKYITGLAFAGTTTKTVTATYNDATTANLGSFEDLQGSGGGTQLAINDNAAGRLLTANGTTGSVDANAGLSWDGNKVIIDGATNPGFAIKNNGAKAWYFYNGAGGPGGFGIYDGTAGSDRFIIKPDGSIGMGGDFYSPNLFLSATGELKLPGLAGTGDGLVGVHADGTAYRLVGIDAGQIVSGLINAARLGTGTANSNTILYGDGTWKTAPAANTYTAVSMGTSADGFNIFDSQTGNQFNFRRIYPGLGLEASILPNGNGIELRATGGQTYTVSTATVSSNITVPAGNYMVKLPDLTISGTNRSVILPDANTNQGKTILIVNANNTSTIWQFSGATVKDVGNNTITNVPNFTSTTLVADGVNWIKTY